MTSFWPQTLVDWAQIFSAIGTCGAVIVSLWIALRPPVPKLSVDADIYLLIGGREQRSDEYLRIGVINVGQTPVTVLNIGWKLRRKFLWGFYKQGLYQFTETDDRILPNTPMPTTLQHGEVLRVSFPLADNGTWVRNLRSGDFFGELLEAERDLRRVRVAVYTSIGMVFYARPSNQLLNLIWRNSPKFRASQPDASA